MNARRYVPGREPWLLRADRCELEASALPIIDLRGVPLTRLQAIAAARAYLEAPTSPWRGNPAFHHRAVALEVRP